MSRTLIVHSRPGVVTSGDYVEVVVGMGRDVGADARHAASVAMGLKLESVMVSSCVSAKSAVFVLAALLPQLRRDGVRVVVDSDDDDVIAVAEALCRRARVVLVVRAQRFVNA